MKIDELSRLKELHHAYIVAGNAEEGRAEVVSVLEKRGVKITGNLDVLNQSFGELLIDHVRETIIPFAFLKALDEQKYVIVSFSRAVREAQNALLKVVEEAPGNTVFFFSVETVGNILPTLRSRCVVVTTKTENRKPETDEAEEFLKATFPKRLQAVEKMTAYITRTQDRTAVREFSRALLSVAHKEKFSEKALRDILNAHQYLRVQGGSAKAVLGHLAVSLPKLHTS